MTALREVEGGIEISVSDDGPGVPEEIVSSVFERFTRADVSRVRHGGGSSTGLGLAIVAAVVAAHGGSVRLDAAEGQNSFVITLPVSQKET